MTYAYNSKIYLAEAVLNVKDLARQTAFYTQILGLEILSQTEEEVLLGAGGKPLVHLIQTDRTESVKASYGLFHQGLERVFEKGPLGHDLSSRFTFPILEIGCI